MMGKISISLRKSAWLLALLIITSALPASAQEEDEDVHIQEGQFNFEYSNDLNGYIISPNKNDGWEWDGNEPYLFIPSKRLKDGKPVVGLSGFGSLKYLDNIEFESPCHVKYICDKCFEYCTSLGSTQGLNLPESIETIGDNAFYSCTGLQSVNLSSNLKSIGRSAFELCKSLESITLPKSLKVIREFAFRNCANYNNWGDFTGGGLESVVFEDGVDFYTNGVYCFYNHVFWGCANLSSVKLPNGTPGRFIIPMGTFGYCGNLKSIELPTNTGKIEAMAFYRTGLESLDLTKIEWKEPFYLQGYYTFAACKNLKTVTAKGKVRFDGLYTFEECTALETVTFTGSGEDYTVMNPDIFKRCSNLKSVKFYRLKGNGLDNDMDSVFTDCPRLESVTSECPPEISKIGYSCFDGCTSLKTLSLPQTEFLINETAFRNCAALESFDFTKVTSLGKGSFSGCTALASTPNISKLTTITENAFQGCTSLTNLEFTDLTSIGPNAFNGCTALASFTFNSSAEDPITATIGSQAFAGCTALESLNFNSSSYNPPTVASEDAFDESHYSTTKVNMPGKRYRDFAGDEIWKKFANLKHPEMYAYTPVAGGYSIRKGDYALDEDFTDIEIPATYNSQDVVAIEAGAFQDLRSLYGVTLHEKIASIGDNAFAGCVALSTIINKRTEPLVCPNTAFGSDTYKVKLTVPFGSLDAYKNTAPWSNFSDIEQCFGNLNLPAPTASPESGDFSRSFELTLTKPNGVEGTIYYYVVSDGDDENAVHPTYAYTTPITIPTKTSKVCAYISWDYTDDVTYRSNPVQFNYTYVPFATETGLDKVLSALDGDEVVINTPLYGHYFDGTYLYASTIANNGSSKTSPTEEQKANESSDIADNFNQEDWVAISGLTSDYVGRTIDSGSVATVGSDPAYPVISLNEGVSYAYLNIGDINTYRVENFNSASASDIWLVAPKPAEYCTVRGYLTAANIHNAEGYLVLQSAEPATNESTEGSTNESTEGSTNENENVTAPLTMNVYYTPGALTLGGDGWYSFTGIVSKDGEALKFTALFEGTKQTLTTNADLLSMKAGKLYEVKVNLEGVKVNGGVLYARTTDESAAPSKPAEDHKGFDSYEDGRKLDDYVQRDWVAIEGLTSEYEGFEIGTFTASYDGVKLTPVGKKPSVGNEVATMSLNTFTVANVFYGNYENTESLGWKDGDGNPYKPFFVKAKVHEVAFYVGVVKAATDGLELWGSGVCGKLNEKGLEIDANDKEINASEGVYQQIEGVLVADAKANGGVKLVALSEPITPTGVAALKADGKATIYGTEGAVVVNGADGKVMIFDAMGRIVKSVSAEGAATVAMPAGYYIVRTAGTAKAVIVK